MREPVRRALISVSDKSGIVDFCRELDQLGVEIVSTGGTFKLLKSNNIRVTDVSDYTGFPEIMDGRVKTLHPKIHGGLLGRPGLDDAIMEELAIPPIDLVVVNLYPFEATIKQPDCTLAQAVENIDIGGPTMLRAAAKNYESTGVIVDASDYPAVLKELRANDNRLSVETCFMLAQKVFSPHGQLRRQCRQLPGRFGPRGQQPQLSGYLQHAVPSRRRAALW